jgi:hypothetical protein
MRISLKKNFKKNVGIGVEVGFKRIRIFSNLLSKLQFG